MLAFSKDITDHELQHSEEDKNAKFRQYMEYHRKLNHEKMVFHALEHAKAQLEKNINDFRGDAAKLEPYVAQAFPGSHRFSNHDNLMLMLRKLINAHNATNNWYRMNGFYWSVVYDCLENFVRTYNRLHRESPEKAKEYGIIDGMEIDFDDWVGLFFNDLDFLIGQKVNYVHFIFMKRNREIESLLQVEQNAGLSLEDTLEKIEEEYHLEPSAKKILLGQALDQKDLELFYTSVENPIYEFLYDPHSQESLLDGEPLIQHAYFIAFQFRGLSQADAESVINELGQISKK